MILHRSNYLSPNKTVLLGGSFSIQSTVESII